MKKTFITLALCFAAAVCGIAKEKPVADIVPMPAKMSVGSGVFNAAGATMCVDPAFDADTKKVVADFAAQLTKQCGVESVVSEGKAVAVGFVFSKDASLGKEEYTLKVSKGAAVVTASAREGVFYAVQTIKQLLPGSIYGGEVAPGTEWVMRCVEIKDSPAFAYRGLHLDPCRHFWTLEQTRKIIDLAAMYKINRFHWHLTEDQGWRIEIKKYPRLTQIGSVRKGTQIGYDRASCDDVPHGGFYTQEEVKEIIRYAQDRCITIIPEVDLPGHMLAALAAYPELGCTDGPYSVWTRWGVSPQVLNPAKPQTMQFLKDVVGELADLFPGEYFHIGGDECPKVEWEKNPLCQALIDSLGLVTDKKATKEQRLQNWVTKQMQDFLATKGKKIIGWDEILEGDLSEGATVMSWRGAKGGIAAAKAGFDVIMTPSTHLYFDFAQSTRLDVEPAGITTNIERATPWQKTYSFDPFDQLNAKQSKRIIGVQANLWTEYISTPEHLEYMLIPRIFPLSELQWSPVSTRDEKRLEKSMAAHQLPLMKRLGYNYRPLDLVPTAPKSSVKDKKRLKLLYWNIQNGMWADQANDYKNFVKWVKTYDPDVCVWCEAASIYENGTNKSIVKLDRKQAEEKARKEALEKAAKKAKDGKDVKVKTQKLSLTPNKDYRYLPGGWDELAARYGHKYVYLAEHRDNYPQVITSKYPIRNVKRIAGSKSDVVVCHGAGWATIKFGGEKINFVSLHTWPQPWGYKVPKSRRKESAAAGEGTIYRTREMEYICNSTIFSKPGLDRENWIMLGDFNSKSPLDYGVYRQEKDDPTFAVHKYILDKTPYIDVIGERHPGKFVPSYGGRKRIDYVYATKPMYDRVVDAYTVVDEWVLPKDSKVGKFKTPSDHRPIYVEFQF